MIQFIEQNLMSILSMVLGGGSFFAYIFERRKNIALTSQEFSKSDQEKIATADKAIDLVNKLQATMDRQYEEMILEQQTMKSTIQTQNTEIATLKKIQQDWEIRCGKCPTNNNK
jgi:hypothetical protein